MKTTLSSDINENETTAQADVSRDVPVAPANTSTSEIVDEDFFNNQQEIDQSAIRTPRIELCHGVGFAPELGFNPGLIVFNREIILAEPTKTEILSVDGVHVTPLSWYEEYSEVLSKEELDAKIKPQRFKTKAAALAAGFIDQKAKKANPGSECRVFAPVLHLKVLVRDTKKCAGQLPLDFGGASYALAEMVLQKGAYWGLGIDFLNHANDSRMYKFPLWVKNFVITAKYESFKGSKPSWCLKGTRTAKNTPEFISWVKSLGL